MASHVFVVLTCPTDGMEGEFNRWYDEEHVPDVLKIPDFVGVQRFHRVPGDPGGEPLRPYLALYETETDDVPATQGRLAAVAGTDAMPFSPAIDMTQAVAWYYEGLGERRADSATASSHDPLVQLVLTQERVAGDLLAVGAVTSTRPFHFAPYKPEAEPLRPHLALNEVDTDDAAAVQAEMDELLGADAQRLSWWYEPIGPRVAR